MKILSFATSVLIGTAALVTARRRSISTPSFRLIGPSRLAALRSDRLGPTRWAI